MYFSPFVYYFIQIEIKGNSGWMSTKQSINKIQLQIIKYVYKNYNNTV
jgi:hypothetical protein